MAADMDGVGPANRLISDNPYLTYAKASQLFAAARPQHHHGVHPSAVISPSASIDPTACIGANVTIADNAVIGAGTVINAGCVIGSNSILGEACLLHANVSLYHDVSLGNRVTIHSNTVIGGDGFGFAPSADRDRWLGKNRPARWSGCW